MGEVYRARDTRLNREVALKSLPDTFAADQDRLRRFSREAQLLASLNHPNIASIYGLEEVDGRQVLVMELVEGEDLSDRCGRGLIPFGVVFWEMLTGRKLFEGETVSDTLAAILTRQPDLSELPASTPTAIRRLLGRCLERDPRNRLRDIGEARIAIAAVTSGGDDSGLPSEPGRRIGIPPSIFIISVAAAVTLSGLLFWQWARRAGTAATTVPEVTEFSIWVDHLYSGWPTAFGLSPDGQRLAWETAFLPTEMDSFSSSCWPAAIDPRS